MKLFTTLLVCLSGAVCVASTAAKEEIVSLTSRFTDEQIRDLQRRVEGCNANVCFAIDGSSSISTTDFEGQKSFVQDTVAVMDFETNPAEIAAVQYANSTSVISRLTTDLNQFFLAIVGATQRGGTTSLTRGINFCIRQLRRRAGEANKIVLLGDGRGDRRRRAVRRANRFRNMGGELCAVGTNSADEAQLLALAGGDPTKVFQVDNFLNVLDLQSIVESLVLDICGMPAPVTRDLSKENASM